MTRPVSGVPDWALDRTAGRSCTDREANRDSWTDQTRIPQKPRRKRSLSGRPSGSKINRYAGAAQRRLPVATGSTTCARIRPGGRTSSPGLACHSSSSAAIVRQSAEPRDRFKSSGSSGDRPRCSAQSASRNERANLRALSPRPPGSWGIRSSSSRSMTAHESSESCVHERRFRLSDPTVAHTSSMTQILA